MPSLSAIPRIVGYVDAGPPEGAAKVESLTAANAVRIVATGVRGVDLYHFPLVKDLRGDLTVGEMEKDLPFSPKRYFIVFAVPSPEVRGQHAHRTCHQFLIAAHGECSVLVDDGTARREIILNHPATGLHIPPMIWGTQWNYSSDAVLLVFASELYDPSDYIRDYADFLATLRGDSP